MERLTKGVKIGAVCGLDLLRWLNSVIEEMCASYSDSGRGFVAEDSEACNCHTVLTAESFLQSLQMI